MTILRADAGTFFFIGWIVLGWLAMAVRWQRRQGRLSKDGVRDKLTPSRSQPVAPATPEARTAARPKPVPARAPARVRDVLSTAGALGQRPVRQAEAPPAPVVQSAEPSTAPAPSVAAPRPAAAAGGGSAERWNRAVALERAGRLAEARAAYGQLALEASSEGRAARQRLERLTTIEGAGWAPWTTNPFGRVPDLAAASAPRVEQPGQTG